MNTDIIVNAANETLQKGGGVCGAIFEAAGIKELQDACNKIGICKTGSAVATEGFALSKYIIHTVGPVWQGGNNNERNVLYACYRNSLKLAKKLKCNSISFPLISAGIFGYPNDKALRVAVKAIGDFLTDNDMDVFLVIFGDISLPINNKFHELLQKNLNNSNIDSNYRRIEKSEFESLRSITAADAQSHSYDETQEALNFLMQKSAFTKGFTSRHASQKRNFSELAGELAETFSIMLFRLIDERGLSDPEVYRKANITRSVFSAIRSKPKQLPSKNTATCLAIALELSLDVTLDLLARAGYTLSPSSMLDMIVKTYINEKKFNIFEINETLYQYGQSLLGTKS
ncbi:MAG: macro domain-containing protein [Oscillospiraceae bacterium]|jgi:O-acetyl-ADP-ribose deacetylase (regulator of RNase III)|nr:macro domain-containing protein [Oscillospiraceae bacterium]